MIESVTEEFVKPEFEEGLRESENWKQLQNFLNTGNYKYIREQLKATVTVGRNDPCICGSGKKYKKCCGK